MKLSVEAAARAAPEEIALMTRGQLVSYAELRKRTRRARAFLELHGVTASPHPQPVALEATLAPATCEMLYALFELGIPALLIHPRWTAHERQHILERVAPSLCIVADWDREHALQTYEPRQPIPEFDPERIAVILATSGTTGQPKLVCLSHRALLSAARSSAQNLSFQARDRWLLCLPLAHIGGLSILTRCLLARRTVVLYEAGAAGLLHTVEELSATVQRERVTLLSLVPTVLDRWLETEPARSAASLRCVLLGGSGVSAGVLDRARAQGLPVRTSYGMTEACSQIATQGPSGGYRELHGVIDSGKPLPGLELRIEDDFIEIRGPQLFSGYLGEAWSAELASAWFRTGDRGFLDGEGRLYVLGRGRDLIISGGENVDPSEVEAALLRHPEVQQACVVGLADATFGQLVAALLVLREAAQCSGVEVVRASAAELASFKRPRCVAVVPSLPYTVSGKVDRAAALAMLQERGVRF